MEFTSESYLYQFMNYASGKDYEDDSIYLSYVRDSGIKVFGFIGTKGLETYSLQDG